MKTDGDHSDASSESASNGQFEGSSTNISNYRDYSRVPSDTLNDTLSLAAQGATAKDPTFPAKLHMILSNPDFHDIVTWLPHGRSWRILQQKAFEDQVIPLYFRHGRYSSFARQVNGWGFRRIIHGSDYNSYYHELFLRGKPHLCEKMRRLTTKDLAKAKKNQDAPTPDFYEMSRDNPLPETTPVPQASSAVPAATLQNIDGSGGGGGGGSANASVNNGGVMDRINFLATATNNNGSATNASAPVPSGQQNGGAASAVLSLGNNGSTSVSAPPTLSSSFAGNAVQLPLVGSATSAPSAGATGLSTSIGSAPSTPLGSTGTTSAFGPATTTSGLGAVAPASNPATVAPVTTNATGAPNPVLNVFAQALGSTPIQGMAGFDPSVLAAALAANPSALSAVAAALMQQTSTMGVSQPGMAPTASLNTGTLAPEPASGATATSLGQATLTPQNATPGTTVFAPGTALAPGQNFGTATLSQAALGQGTNLGALGTANLGQATNFGAPASSQPTGLSATGNFQPANFGAATFGQTQNIGASTLGTNFGATALPSGTTFVLPGGTLGAQGVTPGASLDQNVARQPFQGNFLNVGQLGEGSNNSFQRQLLEAQTRLAQAQAQIQAQIQQTQTQNHQQGA